MDRAFSERAIGAPPSQVGTRPGLTQAAVREVLRSGWGIHADVTPLASERDQNWRVCVEGRPRFVLKIANRADPPGVTDLQQQMMTRLERVGLPCPAVIPTRAGAATETVAGHRAWLIGYLPGVELAEIAEPPPALWRDLGVLLGRAGVALDGFDHPAAHRPIQWDLNQADPVIETHRHAVSDPARRLLVDQCLTRFRDQALPRLPSLPCAVIHNDANDRNLLVEGDRVTGLIDFGDAVHSARVNDLAIACAYAMLDRREPWGVTAAILEGYRSVRSITQVEVDLLPVLIRTRLAMSVCISAHQTSLVPDNDYLAVSQGPVWRLLERLAAERS